MGIFLMERLEILGLLPVARERLGPQADDFPAWAAALGYRRSLARVVIDGPALRALVTVVSVVVGVDL